MQFTKYQHLERLGTTEVEGIEVGEVYVFPKLDGTNASVWVDAEGNLKAGSRNRTLSVESDNAGFCKWVLDNEDKFRPFFDIYPHKILYGEWLVPHSLTTYREDAWRKFYIFDVYEELVVHTEGPVYWGYIYNDSKGRFPDGTFVRTSKVVSVKDGILQTLNTKYKLLYPEVF